MSQRGSDHIQHVCSSVAADSVRACHSFQFPKTNADAWRWWSRSRDKTSLFFGHTVYCNPFLWAGLINNQCISVWLTTQLVLCRVMWYLPLQAGNDLAAEGFEPNQTNLVIRLLIHITALTDSSAVGRPCCVMASQASVDYFEDSGSGQG